ncbi:MAG: ATP-binding protein [Promethearchaeota archaeon]
MVLVLDFPIIGTVFTSVTDNSPNVDHYLFILNENTDKMKAKQGMFCITMSEEGMVVGRIESIFVKNIYFEKPESMKAFEAQNDYTYNELFPSEQWEDYFGYVQVLGVYPYKKGFNRNSLNPEFEKLIRKAAFPAKPGAKVQILNDDLLKKFLGLSDTGLNLGILGNYEIPMKVDINRLINKHFAVLAISGAGKSYLISDILEELLLRPPNLGTPGCILIDVHGEYKFLSDITIAENKKFALKINYYDAKYMEIDVSELNAYDFSEFQPNMSNAQIRELKKVLAELKQEYDKINDDKDSDNSKNNIDSDVISDSNSANSFEKATNLERDSYNLRDIINRIEIKEDINPKLKDALIGWLDELDRMRLFSNKQNPKLSNLVKLGYLSIIDLSSIISLKKKQIIVTYLAKKLFYKRRMNQIPPFLMIIEEAHQFAPESSSFGTTISKGIIETIAREGRKFYAQLCLVSQRPVRLSTTALSQCNTHIILKITNPYDLDHIKASSEALTKETLKMISSLPTGNALIMGSAVNMPLFFRVRERYSKNIYGEKSLEDVCKEFRQKNL